MRDYIKNACEEIDAALFSGDDFIQPDKTIEEFETYLQRWQRKINEIKEMIAEEKEEARYSKLSDEELIKEYQTYSSFQPIGNLYAGIKVGVMYYTEKELRKRKIDIDRVRQNGNQNN